MRADPGSLAAALTRLWVRAYTSGMPPDLRELRRAEIEADLWEHRHDALREGWSPMALPLEIVLRALLGIPDDVGWRLESMRARRSTAPSGRRDTMAVSSRQTRGLALCALVGGGFTAAGTLAGVLFDHPGRIYTSETSWTMGGTIGNVMMAVGTLAAVLVVLGVLGLYLRHRERTRRIGSVGFKLLLAGFVAVLLGGGAYLVPGIEDELADLLVNVLTIPGAVVMIPLGFLLLGIGMPSPHRRLPLFLGWFLVIKSALGFVGIALVGRFPWARVLYRSDSALGEATTVIFGLALVAIGYSMWVESRRDRLPEPSGAISVG